MSLDDISCGLLIQWSLSNPFSLFGIRISNTMSISSVLIWVVFAISHFLHKVSEDRINSLSKRSFFSSAEVKGASENNLFKNSGVVTCFSWLTQKNNLIPKSGLIGDNYSDVLCLQSGYEYRKRQVLDYLGAGKLVEMLYFSKVIDLIVDDFADRDSKYGSLHKLPHYLVNKAISFRDFFLWDSFYQNDNFGFNRGLNTAC